MKPLQEVGFSGEGGISGWRTSVTSAVFQMGLLPFLPSFCSQPGWEDKYFQWRFRPFALRTEPCNACFPLLLSLPAQWTAVPRKSHYCFLLKPALLLLSCK